MFYVVVMEDQSPQALENLCNEMGAEGKMLVGCASSNRYVFFRPQLTPQEMLQHLRPQVLMSADDVVEGVVLN